jgi:hypothetical protein
MMRTIEATGVVNSDHTLSVKLPDDVPAGTHAVVVMLSCDPRDRTNPWTQLPPYDNEFVEGVGTFRREEMYDDDC